MFDKRLRPDVEQRLKPVGANLGKAGLTADHLTLLGVVMAVAATAAIGAGWLTVGFVLLVLTVVPDVLDGAVAKASGMASPRGAFFDSVSDRVTDALLLGGVAWYLSSTHSGRIAVLPLAVLAVTMLVSYERAKAESLGYDAKGGLMERAERIIALGLALLFPGAMIGILWLMLALTSFTAGQRFVSVWRQASVTQPAREPARWRAARRTSSPERSRARRVRWAQAREARRRTGR
ncbi:MAG: CDP-alcohol phosphatidyltransferase family protein [Acidimicrobiales bacterium]